ncbi:hypothetical protein RB614_27925 [Phytohabitans sp. ZYX-F-186]|uniref:WGR domain-containing protein n=1 Tax=Phytohabitans maris TaxID=3071409 RepID=A0ABU0ZR10_9ACTN|nr:hypothetical protein [Phytohabitans sp. ZYX-F-186]MDQ7908362.1 hypothetical protein [Phytohabitans sp. ZYX-F-186]
MIAIVRLPKLLVNARLINPERFPGIPGILVLVQLHHDRDRGWWEVAARKTYGERRETQGRYESEEEADAALGRAYALFDADGTWDIQDFRAKA